MCLSLAEQLDKSKLGREVQKMRNADIGDFRACDVDSTDRQSEPVDID
jgi:hypothetical protein